jgi:hypothetical protein
MPTPSKKIYQIKVTLLDIRPPIWRRLLVSSDVKLDQLHGIIQDAMGWLDCHLHQYQQGEVQYCMPSEEEMMGFGLQMEDESRFRLSDLLKSEKDALFYEYDFGDGWRHKIILEKVLPFEPDAPLARCIKGKRACPPEDCGGPWGYERVLAALADPSDEEHEEMLEWLGHPFDPEHFDLVQTNHFIEIQFSSHPGSLVQ